MPRRKIIRNNTICSFIYQESILRNKVKKNILKTMLKPSNGKINPVSIVHCSPKIPRKQNLNKSYLRHN